MKRVALLVIVTAAVLVPAAAASAGHHQVKIRLAVVPLQTAQLGSAGASLALDYASGPLSDNIPDTRFRLFDLTSFGSPSPGRVGGYALDYGDPFTGSTGVMEIRSSVEEYKSLAEAKWGLLGRRSQESLLRSQGSPVRPIIVTKVKPEAVGRWRFAYLMTLAAPNLNPIVRLDEEITSGRYVLDLAITAGSVSAAERVAPHLLRLLRNRLRRTLGGHPVAAEPVKLPPEPQPGQAPGGPDLSTLILQPSDVGQSPPLTQSQGYVGDVSALSAYLMELHPAGAYDGVAQKIDWWPSATEATYAESYRGPLSLLPFSGTVTPVDLSAVGDGAVGYLIDEDGWTDVEIILTNGQAGEFIYGARESTLQASDVQSLAQAAADRLDAGLGP